jgi:hypothetical protein
MKTVNSNIWAIKVGDTITFTNNVGYKVSLTVTRISEKSCWLRKGRNSWGTIATYLSFPDAKITKS